MIWSFDTLIKLNPNQAQYYRDVTKVEETAPGEVTFFFSTTNNRELPTILGQMLVLPQHWWEGTDANGKQRDIARSTLELPMGSGPYKMKEYAADSSITYERDPNWWGATEPIGIGQYNFDLIRFEYFRDADVAFEGFKGDQFDWWLENRAARWANSYDFPAAQDGRVIKELFPQFLQGFRHHGRLHPESQDRQVQGSARPTCDDAGLRFREPQQNAVLRPV